MRLCLQLGVLNRGSTACATCRGCPTAQSPISACLTGDVATCCQLLVHCCFDLASDLSTLCLAPCADRSFILWHSEGLRPASTAQPPYVRYPLPPPPGTRLALQGAVRPQSPLALSAVLGDGIGWPLACYRSQANDKCSDQVPFAVLQSSTLSLEAHRHSLPYTHCHTA